MTLAIPASGTAAGDLAAVAGAFARLADRIDDAALIARGLADAVDWQAQAARAFHERATAWAGDVSGLACATETVRDDVARARDRAALAAALPGLGLLGQAR